MRILLTRAAMPAAYSIAWSLRKHAKCIVVLADEGPRIAFRSRLVDVVIPSRLPDMSWYEDCLATGASVRLTEYVERMEEICAQYGIDTIYPTFDIDSLILAKFAERFRRSGICTVCPDFASLATSCDKYAQVEAARSVGFPHPKTIAYTPDSDLDTVVAMLGMPVVIKPRFSNGGSKDVLLASTRDEIRHALAVAHGKGEAVLIQEFIPGGREPSLNYLIDGHGEVKCRFCLRKLHYVRPSCSTAVVTYDRYEALEPGARLLKALGATGFCAIQTKEDSRDGSSKLIEVNNRLGANSRILVRMGVNFALLCAQIAKEGTCAPASLPDRCVGVSPFEDLLGLFVYGRQRYLQRRGHIAYRELGSPLPSLGRVLRSYLSLYSKGFVADCLWTSLIRDPFPAFAWYGHVLKGLRHPSRHFIPWGEIG